MVSDDAQNVVMKNKKYYIIIILLISISILSTGCSQRYIIPPGLDHNDFIRAEYECMRQVKYPQNEFFVFGPVVVIVPVSILYAGYVYYKDCKLQKCMEKCGYMWE